MKKAFIWIFYCLGLASTLIFRFFQVTSMTDKTTGFLLPQYKNTNYVTYAICAVFILLLVLLGVFSDGLKRRRNKSVPIGIAAFLLGGTATYAAVDRLGSLSVIGLIDLIYFISTAAFIIFLLYFAVCEIMGKRVAGASAVVPVIYAGVRLVTVFLQNFGLAKTVDVVVQTFMLVLSLIFWQYFGKYVADIKIKSTPRWLYGFALAASLLCMTSTIPTYYATYVLKVPSVREIGSDAYVDLAVGIFILVFVICSLIGEKANNRRSAGYDSDNEIGGDD